jgi:hypothetical protein
VPARVRVFDTDNVLALVTVKVPVLKVIVKPLIVVADATPKVGVVSAGEVSVLFVKVSVPARVAKVPVVGNVTVVAAVAVKVVAKAPEVVKLPPRVMVLPVLATPVPPYCPAITSPFQVPATIVPTVVILDKFPVEITVPEVGNVKDVKAVTVKVVANAPDVVRFPPRVIVLPELATPVPPYRPATTVPCHIPVPIVPTDVSEEAVTPAASVAPVSVPAAAVIVCVPALVREIDEPLSEMLVLDRDTVGLEPSDGVCETPIPVPAVTSET